MLTSLITKISTVFIICLSLSIKYAYSLCVDIYPFNQQLDFANRINLSQPYLVSYFDLENSMYSHVVVVDPAYEDRGGATHALINTNFTFENQWPIYSSGNGNGYTLSDKVLGHLSQDWKDAFQSLRFNIEFKPDRRNHYKAFVTIASMSENTFMRVHEALGVTSNYRYINHSREFSLFFHHSTPVYKNNADWHIVKRDKINSHELGFYINYYSSANQYYYITTPKGIPAENSLKSYLDETAPDIAFTVRGFEQRPSKVNGSDHGFDGIYFLWNKNKTCVEKIALSESKFRTGGNPKLFLLKKFDDTDSAALTKMIVQQEFLDTGLFIQEFILTHPQRLILYALKLNLDGAVSAEHANFYDFTSLDRTKMQERITWQRKNKLRIEQYIAQNIAPKLPAIEDYTLKAETPVKIESRATKYAKNFLMKESPTIETGKEKKIAQQFVKWLLNYKSLNQKQVGDLLGCSKTTVYRFLKNENTPKLINASMLAIQEALQSLEESVPATPVTERVSAYVENAENSENVSLKMPASEDKNTTPTSIAAVSSLSPASSPVEKQNALTQFLKQFMTATGDTTESLTAQVNDALKVLTQKEEVAGNEHLIASMTNNPGTPEKPAKK